MAKFITLCADDFGQASHISRGILTLANNKRISAISCMTTCADWHQHGRELNGLLDQVDIGLHFNLTHGEGQSLPTINRWLLRAISRQINRAFIEKSLNKQLDSFLNIVGRPPDFIDGHQHIHAFPLIRDVFIKVIKARFQGCTPYVRSINPMLYRADSWLKSFVVSTTAVGFRTALDRQDIRYNPKFGGMYSLQPNKPYRQFMIHWLQQATSGSLIMCHPGIESKNPYNDSHPAARANEYHYLLSQAFQEDCEEANVILSRFARSF